MDVLVELSTNYVLLTETDKSKVKARPTCS